MTICRSGKRKEQQMLEEEDAEQRKVSGPDYGEVLLNGPVQQPWPGGHMKRDFAPDSPEIKNSK